VGGKMKESLRFTVRKKNPFMLLHLI